jgi:hypothetical protein
MKTTSALIGGISLILVHAAAGQFTKITTGPLVTDPGEKLTSIWADFDHDGHQDAFVTRVGGDNYLYRNLGNGTFEKLATPPVTSSGGASTAAAWGDYDNDGRLDLFVANRGQGHFLYRGLGGGGFSAVQGSPVLAGGPTTYHCAWVDYDNDGDLDLFVVNLGAASFLYQNNGDGSFTKNTTAAIANVSANWISSAWGDYNGDGLMDVFLAEAAGGPDALYRNDGGGVFTQITTGPIPAGAGGALTGAWADYDNDGDLDLFVANRDGVNFLYRNDGVGGFTKINQGDIVTDVADSNAAAWGDYDNDGWLDLYVANGDTPANQANFLYRNNGNGTFTKITAGAPATDSEYSTSPVWVDYDGDGALDLFVATASGSNSLYRNSGNGNNWLKVRLAGTVSNRSAIGAKVRATAQINGVTRSLLRYVGGDGGFTSQNLELHFGLGDAETVDEVRIEWPSGWVQILNDVAANHVLRIAESTGTTSTHVIPAGLENADGNYYAGTLYSPQMRSQVVYGAANFPGGSMTITELRFRRDVNEPAFNNASANVTVKLSTTTRNPGGLSTTFADNSGSDETTVFNGLWTYSSPTSLPGGTVRPFEIVLPLSTPFTYNPSAGNLLFDIRTTSNTGGNWTDGVNGNHLSRVQSPFDPDSATGASELTGDVIQLVYQTTATLEILPNGGTFTNSVQVSMSSGVPNSVIRYTINGNEPTGASTAYTTPFTLTETATVKARLFVNGFPASEIVAATYTRYVPPDIQFNPAGQLFTNQLSVTLVNHVGAGIIRYTTHGAEPTSASTAYAGPLNLTAGATIRARVFLNTFPVSAEFSETYLRVYAFGDDGVPFAWREQYFGPGFLTNPCAAVGADCDGDGYTVVEEYEHGTDPTVMEIILSVRAVPRLTFSTMAGESYQIQRATTLNPPDWQTIVESILATGTELHYVDADAPDNSYYRIELIQD